MALVDIILRQVFPVAILIFVAGTTHKILKVLLAPKMRISHMPPRKISWITRLKLPIKKWIGALRETIRIDVIHAFASFLFHLPLFAILLLFAPHQTVIFDIVPFVAPFLKPFVMVQQMSEAIITDTTIWGPLDIIVNADLMTILTILAVIILTVNRAVKHALKQFISDLGDYIALAFMLVILFSGYLATHAHGTGLYETYLVIHLLSVALLLIYTPFSKFFHYVFYYWFNLAVYIIHKERRGA